MHLAMAGGFSRYLSVINGYECQVRSMLTIIIRVSMLMFFVTCPFRYVGQKSAWSKLLLGLRIVFISSYQITMLKLIVTSMFRPNSLTPLQPNCFQDNWNVRLPPFWCERLIDTVHVQLLTEIRKKGDGSLLSHFDHQIILLDLLAQHRILLARSSRHSL